MTIDYYRYITSEAWFRLTEPVRKRNHYLCELCNMRYGTVVHHRTYKHLGQELMEELLHLCTECHGAVHGLSGPRYFIWQSRIALLEILQNECIRMGLYGRTD